MFYTVNLSVKYKKTVKSTIFTKFIFILAVITISLFSKKILKSQFI